MFIQKNVCYAGYLASNLPARTFILTWCSDWEGWGRGVDGGYDIGWLNVDCDVPAWNKLQNL